MWIICSLFVSLTCCSCVWLHDLEKDRMRSVFSNNLYLARMIIQRCSHSYAHRGREQGHLCIVEYTSMFDHCHGEREMPPAFFFFFCIFSKACHVGDMSRVMICFGLLVFSFLREHIPVQWANITTVTKVQFSSFTSRKVACNHTLDLQGQKLQQQKIDLILKAVHLFRAALLAQLTCFSHAVCVECEESFYICRWIDGQRPNNYSNLTAAWYWQLAANGILIIANIDYLYHLYCN